MRTSPRLLRVGLRVVVASAIALVTVLYATPSNAAPVGIGGTAAPPGPGVYDFAHPTAPPTAQQLQAGIDDVLRRTPGARQIARNQVQVAPDVITVFPDVAVSVDKANPSRTMSPNYVCSFTYVCMWTDRQYTGSYIVFAACHDVNLGAIAFPSGGYWNDKISSIVNNQTSGTTSYFFNWYNTYWGQLLTVGSGSQLANLALNSSEDGSGSPNDRIDGVHVCGGIGYPWWPNYP